MRYLVHDLLAAPSPETIDYRFDYVDPNGQLEIPTQIKAKYGLAFVLSAILIFIRLYMTIFGRRMRNEGLRWHSLFVSTFNIFQLIFYADTASDSPWYDYMRNVYVTKHALAIEQITLSAFPASISFLIPLYIVTYMVPKLRKTFFFKWFIWLLIYGGLTILAIYCILAYKNSLNGEGNIPLNPAVGYYHFLACNTSIFFTIVLIIWLFMGYLCFCGYAAANVKNDDRTIMKKKMKNNNSLFLFTIYVCVCGMLCAPKNMINMSNFFIYNVIPMFQKGSTKSTPPNENPQQLVEKAFTYVDLAKTIVLYIPIAELLFPIVEFVMASICIKMYRESLIHLFSCGMFYHTDSNGSIWNLIPNRYRAVYPAQSTLPNPIKDEEPPKVDVESPKLTVESKPDVQQSE